jgi:DNA-binding LacI/PurR family transcriptional regulator
MKSDIQSRPSKTREVHAELRGRIVDGRYRPGERLPTFDEMEQEFDVSRMVLQQAVGRLRMDGFVRTFHRKGLFVADAPPHLCRVALLFADSSESGGWSRMNTAMVNETKRLEREHPDWQFGVFEGMVGGRSSEDRLAELEAEVRAHRVAGVVFAPKTFELALRPSLADPAVPKAYVCAPEALVSPPIVGVDSASLYRRALARLVEKGRRRIAILHMADTTKDIDHAALFADFGLALHRPWLQWVGRSHPQFAEQLVPLLLDYPPEQRPDALIIADDNLIEHAAAGIVATGLRVGVDLDVIAHCNWPWPLPSVLPLERIGFDATDILRRAIECIVSQRHGEDWPRLQKVPPLFEWEVEPPSEAPSPTGE